MEKEQKKKVYKTFRIKSEMIEELKKESILFDVSLSKFINRILKSYAKKKIDLDLGRKDKKALTLYLDFDFKDVKNGELVHCINLYNLDKNK